MEFMARIAAQLRLGIELQLVRNTPHRLMGILLSRHFCNESKWLRINFELRKPLRTPAIFDFEQQGVWVESQDESSKREQQRSKSQRNPIV